jgi:hypothetical protein
MKRTANNDSRYEVSALGFIFNTYELIKFLSSSI